MRDLAARIEGLVPPGDLVLDAGDTRADGLLGRAFCATPRARAALARAGAAVPDAPDVAVLRRVNHRRFCAELGQTLPGACYADRREEVDEALAASGDWLLKRPFGFAGRGRLRVRGGAPSAAEHRWIAASLATGEGLQVEPFVARLADFGLHGHLSARGELALGEPTLQRCDERGAWLSTSRATPSSLSDEERRVLVATAEQTAEALVRAGYFGPFGIDAFRWRDASGAARWNPRCEINARYSMGWAIGMGDRRPDL
jgi:hypothetical protein